MADESVLNGIIEELNVEIPLFPSDQKRKFKKFNDLKKFIDKEVEYWKPWSADQMKFVFLAFQQIQTSLQQALDTSDQQEAQQLVRNAVAEASRSQSPLPYSKTAMGKFLNELHARNSGSAKSAYQYWHRKKLVAVLGTETPSMGFFLLFTLVMLTPSAARSLQQKAVSRSSRRAIKL